MKLFDPTSKPVERGVILAPRPASPRGLRLGLVENTKFNAKPILEKLAERLGRRHQTTVTFRTRKRSASHEVDGDAIKALRAQCDLVISGIGD
jgi:hypothetical protein